MTAALFSVIMSIATLNVRPIPEGTPLHVRLTSTVGSYASTPGSAVSAILIAPVIVDGETMLQAGATLAGRVKSVTRVGLGLRHERAGLELEFDRIVTGGDDPIPIATRVTEVENGREHVKRDGRIQGVRSTGSICYRVSGYIRTALQWEIHAELAMWAIRSLLMELPEPEIYYPSGVELTLSLMQPLLVAPEPDAPAIDEGERDELSRIASAMPYQTQTPFTARSSDPTNVLFIGNRDQISDAFQAAGWTEPSPSSSLRDRIHWIRAAAELHGDEAAPMSLLLLNGADPDLAWQKGFNDVSKRHHIRMWKMAETWHGREVWIGAATHDVDFAYLRPGRTLAHKIDGDIDQERDKVAYDLAFSTCASILDWTARPDFPRAASNATGDSISTDGRMVAIELNDCRSPRLSTDSVDDAPVVPEHGGFMQRFLRREILSARNGVLRTNPYWRSYEAGRWLVEYVRGRRQANAQVAAVTPAPVHPAF
jgi:hypothetical protein